MIPKSFRFTGCVRLARFVAGAALACALGNSAHAVLYNWVNTSAGLTGTNSFTLEASFEVPDGAVADSVASPTEITTFNATTVASIFNSMPSGSFTSLSAGPGYLLNSSLNIVNGFLSSSAPGTVFGSPASYSLQITPTTWQQVIQFSYLGQRQSITFNGTGSWVPTLTPPPTNNVPDATSTVGALGLAMAALTGICLRKPRGRLTTTMQPPQ